METNQDYERIKCSTPFYMKLDICKDCGLRTEEFEKDKEYEQYHPKKTAMNIWRCDMREHKNQGKLL